jgi:hypothetical protein
MKNLLKSEKRYKPCSTEESEEINQNQSRDQHLITLEQLSKRQSLARGLKQQEEPNEEEVPEQDDQSNLEELTTDLV